MDLSLLSSEATTCYEIIQR